MIYTVGGIKGGSGKTTVATNLTITLANQGYNVLLIDADDQPSSYSFTMLRQSKQGNIGYSIMQLFNEPLRTQVLNLKDQYNHIIIDTGGRDTESQRAALSVSDVFLIPVAPRTLDVWVLPAIISLYTDIKKINPSLQAFSFLNKADIKGPDNEQASQYLRSHEIISFVDAPLSNRKSFANAISEGLSINELKPKDLKAVQEFTRLCEQFMYLMGTNYIPNK